MKLLHLGQTPLDYLPPDEIDEVLSNVHSASPDTIKRLPTAVPHCDCRDRRDTGIMQPTAADADDRCTSCGNTVFYKPLNMKVREHGYRRYKDGCRCDVCKAAKNAMRQKSRKNSKVKT